MTELQIHNLLCYLGYFDTQEAIKRFQQDHGLEVDGICGPETEKALLEAVCEDTKNDGDFWTNVKYFTRDEFKCKCGGKYCDGFPVEPSELLVKFADRVREHFNSPAIVSSGVRCKTHNANVGGVSNSRHLRGLAMDFCVVGVSSAELLDYVKQQKEVRYAYAIDNSYVHADVE